MKNFKSSNLNIQQSFFKLQKRFIAQGAVYQSEHSKVKLKGNFLKSRRPDMPTMLFFPELLSQVDSYTKFFSDPNHGILNYRNVWLLNPRNTGDSDHHDSFELQDVADDVARFMDEKQLSIVTVGGHGYGAKIACAFGSSYLDKTSGVMCIEGGPIDNSYHPAWNQIREYIKQANIITKTTTNINDVSRKLDKVIVNKRWNKIFKDNLIESSSGISWKCNMDLLALHANRVRPAFTNFGPEYGLFPGRALVQFASESQQIYLATNTIPIYTFFPKLEGLFPSTAFNFIQTEDDENSKFYLIIFLFLLYLYF